MGGWIINDYLDEPNKIIENNFINETLIENPYNDSLIFYEVESVIKSNQEHYLILLERIEKLEIEVNLSKERIEHLDRHINKYHNPKESLIIQRGEVNNLIPNLI